MTILKPTDCFSNNDCIADAELQSSTPKSSVKSDSTQATKAELNQHKELLGVFSFIG